MEAAATDDKQTEAEAADDWMHAAVRSHQAMRMPKCTPLPGKSM